MLVPWCRSGLSKRPQKIHKLADSDAAVADGVLFLETHLGHRSLETIRHKDRIITEATCAAALSGDGAVHYSFEDSFVSNSDQGDYRSEPGFAVLTFVEVPQQQFNIVLTISLLACVAGGKDARGAVKGVNLQPGVVGETGQMITIVYVGCFLKGVAFKGGLRFLQLCCVADLGQT